MGRGLFCIVLWYTPPPFGSHEKSLIQCTHLHEPDDAVGLRLGARQHAREVDDVGHLFWGLGGWWMGVGVWVYWGMGITYPSAQSAQRIVYYRRCPYMSYGRKGRQWFALPAAGPNPGSPACSALRPVDECRTSGGHITCPTINHVGAPTQQPNQTYTINPSPLPTTPPLHPPTHPPEVGAPLPSSVTASVSSKAKKQSFST